MNYTERAIVERLKNSSPRSSQEIAYTLDQPDPSIRRTLLAMHRRGLVMRDGSRGDGYRYYLAETDGA